MSYVKLTIETTDNTEREIFIAHLADAGFESFEEEGLRLYAYIPAAQFEQAVVNEVLENRTYKTEIIEQENWNANWERDFAPVTVSDFCRIRADFHEYDGSYKYDIIITPKMSFGTGHHATTRLMIEQMSRLDFSGKKVLDFGTGTGVLAILATKLGAGEVWAIDNDEWSYDNTKENIARNDSTGIEVAKGSLEVVEDKMYDIILANINRHILLQYMQQMRKTLHKGGYILMSGILTEDETLITSEAEKAGFKKGAMVQEGQWICILFE